MRGDPAGRPHERRPVVAPADDAGRGAERVVAGEVVSGTAIIGSRTYGEGRTERAASSRTSAQRAGIDERKRVHRVDLDDRPAPLARPLRLVARSPTQAVHEPRSAAAPRRRSSDTGASNAEIGIGVMRDHHAGAIGRRVARPSTSRRRAPAASARRALDRGPGGCRTADSPSSGTNPSTTTSAAAASPSSSAGDRRHEPAVGVPGHDDGPRRAVAAHRRRAARAAWSDGVTPRCSAKSGRDDLVPGRAQQRAAPRPTPTRRRTTCGPGRRWPRPALARA